MHPDCYSPVSQHPEPPAARPVCEPTGAELRDLFAMAALYVANVANVGSYPTPDVYADWAYQVADAMLARRARQ